MGGSCSSDDLQIGDKCYGPCPDDYTQLNNGLCARNCPDRFRLVNTECVRLPPAEYNRGIGYEDQGMCVSATHRSCTRCGDRWYPSCIEGYAPSTSSCNTCRLKCPNGTVSDTCTTSVVSPVVYEPSISWGEVFVIALILIIIISVVIRAFAGYSINVTDVIIGDPEHDAYHVLTTL